MTVQDDRFNGGPLEAAIFNCQCDQMQNYEGGRETIDSKPVVCVGQLLSALWDALSQVLTVIISDQDAVLPWAR